MRRVPWVPILFILYCIEAGTLMLMSPWSAVWDRIAVQIPIAQLRSLSLHPFLRSAVSAFGAVHLLWAAHDLDLLLARWKAARARVPEPGRME